jgi:glucose/arabinose dehydrogenase
MPRTALTASVCIAILACLPLTASAKNPERLPSESGELTIQTLAQGLEYPWAVAFLPEAKGMLITERSGRLRLLDPAGVLQAPISGVPEVWAKGQGGLLDVALSPDFRNDRWVYLAFAEAGGADGNAGAAVGRGKLSADATRLEDFKVIFRQQPKLSTGNHFGVRLVFDRAGYLFIALGENNQRSTAQDLDKLQGKIVRLFADGGVPPDNPFVGRAGARPEIWSYGHRNQQGAALNPWTGTLWTSEHGPRGGDELNLIASGGNYGWPQATQGINYSGLAIPEARGASLPGMVDPVYAWDISPALSGMTFYDSPRFKAWDHSVFFGALKSKELIRLKFEGERIVHEERLLGELKARIRDVRQGPDGYLYVLTDAAEGQLLKVGLQ